MYSWYVNISQHQMLLTYVHQDLIKYAASVLVH